MGNETKEKITALATDLIQQVGYPSLSYQQISSQLGIKNAAVHYYFPTKEDLGLDVVRQDQIAFDKFLAASTTMGYQEKLEAFLVSYQTYLTTDNKICVIGASASDYRQIPASIQKAAAEYLTTVKNWFVTLLDEGRAAGVFSFKGTPENKASLVVSALAGALQHARLIGNDHYLAVVAQIKLELQP